MDDSSNNSASKTTKSSFKIHLSAENGLSMGIKVANLKDSSGCFSTDILFAQWNGEAFDPCVKIEEECYEEEGEVDVIPLTGEEEEDANNTHPTLDPAILRLAMAKELHGKISPESFDRLFQAGADTHRLFSKLVLDLLENPKKQQAPSNTNNSTWKVTSDDERSVGSLDTLGTNFTLGSTSSFDMALTYRSKKHTHKLKFYDDQDSADEFEMPLHNKKQQNKQPKSQDEDSDYEDSSSSEENFSEEEDCHVPLGTSTRSNTSSNKSSKSEYADDVSVLGASTRSDYTPTRRPPAFIEDCPDDKDLEDDHPYQEEGDFEIPLGASTRAQYSKSKAISEDDRSVGSVDTLGTNFTLGSTGSFDMAFCPRSFMTAPNQNNDMTFYDETDSASEFEMSLEHEDEEVPLAALQEEEDEDDEIIPLKASTGEKRRPKRAPSKERRPASCEDDERSVGSADTMGTNFTLGSTGSFDKAFCPRSFSNAPNQNNDNNMTFYDETDSASEFEMSLDDLDHKSVGSCESEESPLVPHEDLEEVEIPLEASTRDKRKPFRQRTPSKERRTASCEDDRSVESTESSIASFDTNMTGLGTTASFDKALCPRSSKIPTKQPLMADEDSSSPSDASSFSVPLTAKDGSKKLGNGNQQANLKKLVQKRLKIQEKLKKHNNSLNDEKDDSSVVSEMSEDTVDTGFHTASAKLQKRRTRAAPAPAPLNVQATQTFPEQSQEPQEPTATPKKRWTSKNRPDLLPQQLRQQHQQANNPDYLVLLDGGKRKARLLQKQEPSLPPPPSQPQPVEEDDDDGLPLPPPTDGLKPQASLDKGQIESILQELEEHSDDDSCSDSDGDESKESAFDEEEVLADDDDGDEEDVLPSFPRKQEIDSDDQTYESALVEEDDDAIFSSSDEETIETRQSDLTNKTDFTSGTFRKALMGGRGRRRINKKAVGGEDDEQSLMTAASRLTHLSRLTKDSRTMQPPFPFQARANLAPAAIPPQEPPQEGQEHQVALQEEQDYQVPITDSETPKTKPRRVRRHSANRKVMAQQVAQAVAEKDEESSDEETIASTQSDMSNMTDFSSGTFQKARTRNTDRLPMRCDDEEDDMDVKPPASSAGRVPQNPRRKNQSHIVPMEEDEDNMSRAIPLGGGEDESVDIPSKAETEQAAPRRKQRDLHHAVAEDEDDERSVVSADTGYHTLSGTGKRKMCRVSEKTQQKAQQNEERLSMEEEDDNKSVAIPLADGGDDESVDIPVKTETEQAAPRRKQRALHNAVADDEDDERSVVSADTGYDTLSGTGKRKMRRVSEKTQQKAQQNQEDPSEETTIASNATGMTGFSKISLFTTGSARKPMRQNQDRIPLSLDGVPEGATESRNLEQEVASHDDDDVFKEEMMMRIPQSMRSMVPQEAWASILNAAVEARSSLSGKHSSSLDKFPSAPQRTIAEETEAVLMEMRPLVPNAGEKADAALKKGGVPNREGRDLLCGDDQSSVVSEFVNQSDSEDEQNVQINPLDSTDKTCASFASTEKAHSIIELVQSLSVRAASTMQQDVSANGSASLFGLLSPAKSIRSSTGTEKSKSLGNINADTLNIIEQELCSYDE